MRFRRIVPLLVIPFLSSWLGRASTAQGARRCAPAPAVDVPSSTPEPDRTPSSPPDEGPSPPPGPAATAPRPPSAAEAIGRKPSRVKCLDESLVDEFGRARVRKGVQVRPFRKALRLQLGLSGGLFAGDLADTNWQVGGELAFWIAEEFGIDAQFRLAPLTLRMERSATGFSGQDRYPDGQVENFSYSALGHLLWAPLHTKLRAGKDRVIHGDFILVAGAGPTYHATTRGVGFDLGMRLALYPTRWLSVRLDLSDHILAQEILGSRRISNNLVFSTAVGFWIPFRR